MMFSSRRTINLIFIIHITFIFLVHCQIESDEDTNEDFGIRFSTTTQKPLDTIEFFEPHVIDIDGTGEVPNPPIVNIPDPNYIPRPNVPFPDVNKIDFPSSEEIPDPHHIQFGIDEIHHPNPLDYGHKPCQCVPWWQCKNDTTTYHHGEDVLNIRIRENECRHYADICCKHPVHIPIPPIRPHSSGGCGYRNEHGVGFRITGNNDHEAQFGEFPWMVAVLTEHAVDHGSKIYQYQCGGSLIHPRVALTAAHCVHNKKSQHLKVRAGEWDTQTKHELFPHQESRVKSVIIHHDFYSGGLFNDIALLVLEESFILGDNVDTICLPDQDEDSDHTDCYASGWGKDAWEKSGSYQVILKKVELPVVPKSKCTQALRRTKLGPHFQLHDSFICAGGEEGRDTCKGDGGSPLACPIPGKPGHYQQAGIVAWGIGCGEDEIPGVYSNVAHFRHWIDKQFRKLDLETHYYSY